MTNEERLRLLIDKAKKNGAKLIILGEGLPLVLEGCKKQAHKRYHVQ